MTETVTVELAQAVGRVIRTHVPEIVGEIQGTAALEELGVDSMTLVDVVLELQDAYSVEFPDDALAEIQLVQDLIDALRALRAAQA